MKLRLASILLIFPITASMAYPVNTQSVEMLKMSINVPAAPHFLPEYSRVYFSKKASNQHWQHMVIHITPYGLALREKVAREGKDYPFSKHQLTLGGNID